MNLKNFWKNNKLLIILVVIAILGALYFDETSNKILFATFLALFWYAWETRELKEEAIKQTEIEQKPVMILYVRNLNNITDATKKLFKREYTINNRTSYYLSLRNVGRGPAFNVEVKNQDDIFMVEKYQCRFFAPEPKGDEQAIKMVKKDNSEIRSYDNLENVTFKVSCKNIDGKLYNFQYKIIDIEKREVEFISKYDSN
ncbi:hypothetical protein KKB43_01985 [Patescibacteria group bacterium]|nr:hypothetical protein [Patescibacteria group bacterium]